jgi:hypothetical protein
MGFTYHEAQGLPKFYFIWIYYIFLKYDNYIVKIDHKVVGRIYAYYSYL